MCGHQHRPGGAPVHRGFDLGEGAAQGEGEGAAQGEGKKGGNLGSETAAGYYVYVKQSTSEFMVWARGWRAWTPRNAPRRPTHPGRPTRHVPCCRSTRLGPGCDAGCRPPAGGRDGPAAWRGAAAAGGSHIWCVGERGRGVRHGWPAWGRTEGRTEGVGAPCAPFHGLVEAPLDRVDRRGERGRDPRGGVGAPGCERTPPIQAGQTRSTHDTHLDDNAGQGGVR